MKKKRSITKKSLSDSDRLDIIISLLSHLLTVQLYKSGATMDDICRHLHIAKTSVVDMLKGFKRKLGNNS